MKKVIIIPARHASSRFPGKPLAMIGGKTMIERVVAQCLMVNGVDDVIVATDHVHIAGMANSAGALSAITGIHHSGSDRVAEAARQQNLDDNDIVVNVQGDVPFISPRLIEQLIDEIVGHDHYDIVTAARKRDDTNGFYDKNNVKVVIDRKGKALSFTRTPFYAERNGDGTWLNHIGIYAYRNSSLQRFVNTPQSQLEKKEKLEQLRVIYEDFYIHVAISQFDCGVDVNTPEDLVMANKMTLCE